MDDTFESIIAIGLAAIVMFIIPLVSIANRQDDVTQLTVDIAVSEFVNDVKTTGIISGDNYSKCIESLNSTGNSFSVDMVVKILDDNADRRLYPGGTTDPDSVKNQDNRYFAIYTSQILEKIYSNKSNGMDEAMKLKEGDVFSVTAKNDSTPISQQLKRLFFGTQGELTYYISSSESGIVTATGL